MIDHLLHLYMHLKDSRVDESDGSGDGARSDACACFRSECSMGKIVEHLACFRAFLMRPAHSPICGVARILNSVHKNTARGTLYASILVYFK
ncbi:hypothetical protein HPP92_020592 [Vanilla planifolia]|uniref:Uncharacterized protein n=1 Tax=Vanilla planifolia TaxID=51239 RepID=A0A835UJX6_VANPL|nr:hypothetical protein HPP92_020592 [Vanilla planifolia]